MHFILMLSINQSEYLILQYDSLELISGKWRKRGIHLDWPTDETLINNKGFYV